MTIDEVKIIHNTILHLIVTVVAFYNFSIFSWWWWKQKRATTIYALTCFLMFGIAFSNSGAVWLYANKWLAGDWDLNSTVPFIWTVRHYFTVIPLMAYSWYVTRKIYIDYIMVKLLQDGADVPTCDETTKDKLTVLVADDNKRILYTTKLALERYDYEVLVATNGFEAYSIFQKSYCLIDCVILDLVMPERDGWETLELMREIVPNVPAIMVSGYVENHFAPKNPVQDFCLFLRKPFNLKKLANAIEMCVAGVRK